MVRAGGLASRTIGDRSATDPGGGSGGPGGRQPAWQGLVGRVLGSHWTPNEQAFPPLGATPQRIANGVKVRCWTALKKYWEVGPQWCRSLLWRWAEVLCQWLPRCLELVNIGISSEGVLGRPQ